MVPIRLKNILIVATGIRHILTDIGYSYRTLQEYSLNQGACFLFGNILVQVTPFLYQ